MANPVLVEVTRGFIVESTHRGAFALCDPSGTVVASAGDIDRPVFPRSSVKALQALALVESGGADRLGLSDAELALLCASHGGEPVHIESARTILAKAGRSESNLECGAHWPTSKPAARTLISEGRQPSALHNNCSGKHAGFLCLACTLDTLPEGYVGVHHPVQQTIKAVMGEVYGHDLGDSPGIDGCSIPTYAVPLRAIAAAFARLATGEGFAPSRRAAAERLRHAVAAHPIMVGGTGFLDTVIASHFGAKVFTKTGAEGVFCAALPEQGLGLALKCDDGATRGSEFILLHLLDAIMRWSTKDRAAFADRLDPVLRNWNGIEVGHLRPTDAMSRAEA